MLSLPFNQRACWVGRGPLGWMTRADRESSWKMRLPIVSPVFCWRWPLGSLGSPRVALLWSFIRLDLCMLPFLGGVYQLDAANLVGWVHGRTVIL